MNPWSRKNRAAATEFAPTAELGALNREVTVYGLRLAAADGVAESFLDRVSEAIQETFPRTDDFDADAGVRNVILLFADGLGPAHVVAARSELVGLNGRLGFERMPVSGWFTTHEDAALITDSAASGTARRTAPLRPA